MSTLRKIALALVIIGAINWGLVGLFRFDLVATIFGAGLSRLIFVLVGLSGLICLSYFFDRETVDKKENYSSSVFNEGTARPNYGTEFAEEPDLDLAYNPSRDAYEGKDDDEK